MLNREDLAAFLRTGRQEVAQAAFRRLAARAPASPAGTWPAARQ